MEETVHFHMEGSCSTSSMIRFFTPIPWGSVSASVEKNKFLFRMEVCFCFNNGGKKRYFHFLHEADLPPSHGRFCFHGSMFTAVVPGVRVSGGPTGASAEG